MFNPLSLFLSFSGVSMPEFFLYKTSFKSQLIVPRNSMLEINFFGTRGWGFCLAFEPAGPGDGD